MNVYPFIGAEQEEQRNVKRACELLQVSRAAYYADRGKEPSSREQEDAELAEVIKQVHDESKGRYGAPRIHAELRQAGRRHGRKRVARLMRAGNIRGRTPRRWKKTTIPDPAAAAWADLIRRDFSTDASMINARWCGDITCVPTWEGWLYLATVLDIASRRDALGRAHRSKLGQRARRELFASLKGKCLDQQAWPSRAAARRAVVEYIAWFNGMRLHSALGYLTPNEFEAAAGKEGPAKVA